MGLIDRIQTGVMAGLTAARGAESGEQIEAKLNTMIESGDLDSHIMGLEVGKEAAKKSKTFLNIHRTRDQIISFYSLLLHAVKEGELPPHGDPTRDLALSTFWMKEPILAGAVYSMSAKMSTLGWTVTGRKNLAKYYAELYSRAISMEGQEWGGFISASAQDFYTADRGVFWETPRVGSNRIRGSLADLGHIDTLQCALTGNSMQPVFYLSEMTSQQRFFKPGEFIHFSSLPSGRERHLGIGFCASSRAHRAAKLLLGLHDYDEQKLSNLPPEGVAGVSGLTQEEFKDSLELWKAERQKNSSLTYPQVLWLLSSQPNSKVAIDFTGFSQMPESFERRTVVEQYVNTLALVFGVDAREFWPISTSAMGTAAESEIQHMKAKGKGPGEFIGIVERQLNGELPEGVEFGFDTQDIAEDEKAAIVAKTWIEALLPLVTGGAPGGPKMDGDGNNPTKTQPSSGQPKGQPSPSSSNALSPAGPTDGSPAGIITVNEFLRLLADRGVLPNYLVKDKRVVITDSGIAEKEYSDDVVYKYKAGILTVHRLAPIIIASQQNHENVPYATVSDTKSMNVSVNTQGSDLEDPGSAAESLEDYLLWLKQAADDILEGKRNIRGKPISNREALRGDKITASAIQVELERWRAHPILSKYAPPKDEEEPVLESLP